MKDLFVTYGIAAGLILIAFTVELLLGSIIGKESIYLLFIIPVVISAWYGGIKTGSIATVFSAAIIFNLFFFNVNSYSLNTSFLIQLLVFIGEGFGMSYLIDRLGKIDLVNQYKQKEKLHAKIFAELQGKYALAQEEIKARDEFLLIASHELKTPLTSMLLQIQTALHNIRNVSLAKFSVAHLLKMLENAEGQTHRLSKMINDLLNVSLITTKKMDLELEEIDLSTLTKEVVDNFSERLNREGYEINLDIKPSIIGLFDKVRIEQAVTNLLSNAIKYGDKKPLEVKVFNSNGTGKIIIKDHGIGIPSDQKEKVFELFERAVPSTKYKGLGVGLFITNQIVKAHGGKIHVDTEENEGSSFTLELPLKKTQSN